MGILFEDTLDRDKDQLREVRALDRINDDGYDAFLDFYDWCDEIAKGRE